MQRPALPLMLAAVLVLLGASAGIAQQQPATVDPGGQVARFINADLSEHLARAPRPAALPEDLKLHLVDYIDCTADDRLHPFLDDGLGGVGQPAAGQCRQTGPAANSYFAYRFRVAEAGRPHVVVFEFPDDADRMTAIALAQPPSGDDDKPAARVEFGYRTGDLLPTSGGMVTRWTFFFPTSVEPAALLVANWHARTPAVLARAWVYVVEDESLPTLAPAEGKFLRHAGRYDGDPQTLFTRFGGRVENLVQVMGYLGMDEIGLDAMRDRRFGYPSAQFAAGSQSIPSMLPALAEAGKRLVAIFDPDCSIGVFSMPGQKESVADISMAGSRKAWQDFIDLDFLKAFAEQQALAGIMLGGPRGSAAFDARCDHGYTTFLQGLADTLGRYYRGLRLYQAMGGPTPGSHCFMEPDNDWQPVGRWEMSEKSMDRCIAEHVLDVWRLYGFEEQDLARTNAVLLMRQCDRDDAACYRFGHNAVPRYWLLDAAASSPEVSDLTAGADVRGLVLSGTEVPRMLLLRPGAFWWSWTELAPTFTPGGEGFFLPAARAVANGVEPYTVWLSGGGAAAALHEEETRLWLRVLRSLPFRSFAPLAGAAEYPVSIRTYLYMSDRYVLAVNVAPVAATVTLGLSEETAVQSLGRPIDGRRRSVTLELQPGEIAAFRISDEITIDSAAQQPLASEALLAARLRKFADDLAAAKAAGIAMAAKYDRAAQAAREALGRKDLAEADRLLNVAVVREPGLRLRLLNGRPRVDVPRANAIVIDGRLDDWKAAPAIELRTVEHLVADRWAANHWKGPGDLSAELRLAWSEAGLYFALTVTDDAATNDEGELAALTLSKSAYRSHTDRPGFDRSMTLSRRADSAEDHLVTVRRGAITVHEGLILWSELGAGLKPASGLALGLNLLVSDSDDRAGMPHPWCRANVMAWSNRQDGYGCLVDAQACGEITLK